MKIYQPSQTEKADPAWAWSPYAPDAQSPWNLALVGHLHRRVTFGASWEQMQQSLEQGPQATINRLFEGTATDPAFARTFADYERSAVKDLETLGAWWLRRLIETPDPLRECMTVFWHNHFAISGRSFDNMQTLVAHIQGLRRLGLGSFQTLLHHLADDPALYVALDANAHRRRQPSDTFVRPLIETFTLGPGVCSNEDLAAAARAWSGWFVYRERLRFIERERDTGAKTFLGQTGNWQREDILRMILAERAAAMTVVRKLYRWLISETDEPDTALLRPLAESFARDFLIEPLVATILRSRLFFSSVACHQRIKSPVDYAIGLVKSMEGTVSTTLLAADVAALGQRLGDPPTVQGWTGGRYWINATTLTERHNLAEALLSGADPYGDRLQVERVVNRYGQSERRAARSFLNQLLLQTEATVGAGEAQPETDLRQTAYRIVTRPEYQLA